MVFKRGLFETDIEKEMATILDSLKSVLGINYTRYYPLRACRLEMDFAYPELKICVECDGEHWHRDKNKDRRRDYFLKRRGWETIRFTGSQIKNEKEFVKKSVEEKIRWKIKSELR